MPRYKILIEYDGTDFAGWQKQKHMPSIQEEIEKAIFKFTHEKVEVYGSGRTDSGVHAFGQIAHFDLKKQYPLHKIIHATNFHLPANKIALLSCQKLDTNFHARFSAVKRAYKYLILNRPVYPTLELNRVWHVRKPLDIEKMQSAAKLFEGLHDFTALKTAQCQAKSHIKTIDYIKISKDGDHISIKIAARSFIHKMVRSIVGILTMIGHNKWQEDQIKSLLNNQNTISYRIIAPPSGLYLEKIEF